MSKSEHARKPKMTTRTVTRHDWFTNLPYTLTVTSRDVLRKDADREYEEMHGNFGKRPYQGKKAAIHEGLMDLMDVQDEQAIAEDGFDQEVWAERQADLMGLLSAKVLDDDQQPKVPGALLTTETPKALAVVIDTSARAMIKHKAKIAQDMAEGVIYRDIDPYTLEPYDRSIHPKGFVRVSRSTSTSRRNHAKKSSWA